VAELGKTQVVDIVIVSKFRVEIGDEIGAQLLVQVGVGGQIKRN